MKPNLIPMLFALALAAHQATGLAVGPPLMIERLEGGIAVHYALGPCGSPRLQASGDLSHWADVPTDPVTVGSTSGHVNLPLTSEPRYFRTIQDPVPGCAGEPFGYWPLDGDWHDAAGHHDLTPLSSGGFSPAPYPRSGDNTAYGPTGSETGNGALAADLTGIDETNGITLSGWVWLPDNSTGGTLFGFGDASWETPKLNFTAAWGFIDVYLGRQGDGTTVRYPRIGDTCWHHLALVLPAGFRTGTPFKYYLDGQETPPSVGDNDPKVVLALDARVTLWGSPFRIGTFVSPDGKGSAGRQRVDEVRLWARALSAAEIQTEARSTGAGKGCEVIQVPDWAPGPRFLPPNTFPTPAPTLGVHVLSADTLAVITDPNPWLKERLLADCGNYLRAMESNRVYLESWVPDLQYRFATREIVSHYRPAVLAGVTAPNHFQLDGPGGTTLGHRVLGHWPQSTREFRTPRVAPGTGEEHTDSVEVVFYSYLKLDAPLAPGSTVRITDAWNRRTEFTYDENRTISWALKVNQVGYLPDAPTKFAYLGSWLGPAGGAMEFPGIEGREFQVCRESDHEVAFTGRIAFRADESVAAERTILSGEKVYQLDFSSFRTPGHYYLRVPGIGRSWGFEIGQNALGQAFYTHARGLTHQRCGVPLGPPFTQWTRGDAHTNTYRAAFPTEFEAFSPDILTAGWGLTDASGRFPTFEANFDPVFGSVKATVTPELIPGLTGGWHDAADFDRTGWRHVLAVEDLVESYLLFPANFTDGQLDLPEGVNGLPDILDEAVWGMEVWRRAQEPDGRVALHIEGPDGAAGGDPARDPQRYYLGLASRDTSLQYAEHAARLARALSLAGDAVGARRFLDSAKRAYTFATTSTTRITSPMTLAGIPVTWSEPPQPLPSYLIRARIQLWLATGDPQWREELETPAMQEAFTRLSNGLEGDITAFDLADLILAPERFPENWGTRALQRVLENVDEWVREQSTHAYRMLWHATDHRFFLHLRWGRHGFNPARGLVVAWRATGEERYRAGALNAVDWAHGANPQGRVYTTGLGSNFVVHPLHGPSDTDGIDEPVPGITIFGLTGEIIGPVGERVYGLFDAEDGPAGFSAYAIPQLPPPWNDPGLGAAQIRDTVESLVPLWRRIVTMENLNVWQMEFTVTETISRAAAVTGCLMGPGWKPSAALTHRQPRPATELRDALWYHP